MGNSANPRRHPHVADTVDYMRHLGADDVEVIGKKSGVQVCGKVDGRKVVIALPRVTRSHEVQSTLALQAVRRRFREAGVEVRA